MPQLIINVENQSVLSSLKKILSIIDGVSIEVPKKQASKRCGLDEALAEVEEGKIFKAKNAEDMFQQILGA